MQDPNLINLDEYEIISEPSQSQPLTPSTESEEILETEPSIKDPFQPRKKTDLIRNVARVVVTLSLPFALAWHTFIAVVESLYNHHDNEQLLLKVSQTIISVIDTYRHWLDWVDESLHEYLEALVLPNTVALLVDPVLTLGLDIDLTFPK